MSDKMNPDWWKKIDPQFEFENLSEFKEIKQLLKTQDKLELPDDDEFFNRMHSKIMKNIETQSVQIQKTPIWVKRKASLKKTAAIFMGFLFILFGQFTSRNQSGGFIGDATLATLPDAMNRSSFEDSVIVYQHKSEFFLDLAGESLDHLTVGQMKALMQSDLKN